MNKYLEEKAASVAKSDLRPTGEQAVSSIPESGNLLL